MPRYALRPIADTDLPCEPVAPVARLALRVVRSDSALLPAAEVTRCEGRRVAAPAVVVPDLAQSGIFDSAPRALEPTLMDARLAVDLAHVERALGEAYDPSMATSAMRVRVQEMCEVADALERIHVLSLDDGLSALFAHHTALSRYLRGLKRWCGSFAAVCHQLVEDVRVGPADWSTLRRRVATAAASHRPDLVVAAAEELAVLRDSRPDLRARTDRLAAEVEELFSAADWLEESTRRYIGDGS